MTLKEQIIEKVTSGRFILTVIGGAVFTYSVCSKILPSEATASILTMVFISYFQRHDRKDDHVG
jgi:hypothetical protein